MIEKKLLIYLLVFLLLMLCIYCWYKPCMNNKSSNGYTGGYMYNENRYIEYPRMTGGYSATNNDEIKDLLEPKNTAKNALCMNQNNLCYVTALYNAALPIFKDDLYNMCGGEGVCDKRKNQNRGYFITASSVCENCLGIDSSRFKDDHTIDKTLNDKFISIVHKGCYTDVKVAYYDYVNAPTVNDILDIKEIVGSKIKNYENYIISEFVSAVIEVNTGSATASGHYLALWIYAPYNKELNDADTDWKFYVINDGINQETGIGNSDSLKDHTYAQIKKCFGDYKVRLILAPDGGSDWQNVLRNVDNVKRVDVDSKEYCKLKEVQYDNKFIDLFIKPIHVANPGLLDDLYNDLEHLTVYEALGQKNIHDILDRLQGKDVAGYKKANLKPYTENFIPFGLTAIERGWYETIAKNWHEDPPAP